MSAQLQTRQTTQTSNSVSTISVQCRVDYILRFSKHPAIVLSAQKQHYSDIASLFLTMLPANQNVAFVSASEKLTNIQLRCRIIEQLFGDQLFDPEQPLYVSIGRLLKQQREAMTIVIEHGHFLTKQMLHELCQLSEVVKKLDKSVGIALFAELSLGMKLAQERSLFEKRISIISAEQGQLLPLKAKIFRPSRLVKYNKLIKLAALSVAICIIAGSGYWLFIHQVLFNSDKNKPIVSSATQANAPAKFVLPSNKEMDNKLIATPAKVITQPIIAKAISASPSDILQAIQATSNNTQVDKIAAASPSEITDALQLASVLNTAPPSITSTNTTEPNKSAAATPVTSIKPDINKIDAQYYQSKKSGYVIQYGGFEVNATYLQFIAEHPKLTYMGYYRRHHDADYLVITSQVYATKKQAMAALNKTSKALLAEGAWLKPIREIHKEIDDFNLTRR